MARKGHRRNPRGGIPWDAILLIGGGYYAYTRNLFGLQDLFRGGGGSLPPGGGFTFDQACTAARAALGNLDPYWKTATCEQVKAHVCQDRTIFVSPTGTDAAIRKAFGCPL